MNFRLQCASFFIHNNFLSHLFIYLHACVLIIIFYVLFIYDLGKDVYGWIWMQLCVYVLPLIHFLFILIDVLLCVIRPGSCAGCPTKGGFFSPLGLLRPGGYPAPSWLPLGVTKITTISYRLLLRPSSDPMAAALPLFLFRSFIFFYPPCFYECAHIYILKKYIHTK